MRAAGLEDEPAVGRWLEKAEEDPLPKTRLVAEEWEPRRTSEAPRGC